MREPVTKDKKHSELLQMLRAEILRVERSADEEEFYFSHWDPFYNFGEASELLQAPALLGCELELSVTKDFVTVKLKNDKVSGYVFYEMPNSFNEYFSLASNLAWALACCATEMLYALKNQKEGNNE